MRGQDSTTAQRRLPLFPFGIVLTAIVPPKNFGVWFRKAQKMRAVGAKDSALRFSSVWILAICCFGCQVFLVKKPEKIRLFFILGSDG